MQIFHCPCSYFISKVVHLTATTVCYCTLWQYGLWSFQTGYTKLERLAYLGAYGTPMFALRVWVGDGTRKSYFFSYSITLKMFS